MRATCERSLYRTLVKESRDGIRQHFTTTNNETLSSAANNVALSSTTNNAALSSLPSTVFSPPLLQAHACNQVPDLLVCTTLLISPSRSTTLITLSNLALCTSRRQGSVPFLVYAVRACPARLTILLMRRLTLVRERTLWLVWYTTSFHTTLWGRHAYIYMRITVLCRIKTIPFSSTVRGGFCLVSTSQSPCHSCSLGTRSSRLTGALACSSSGSGELSSAVYKTWLMLSIHLQM